MSTTTRATLVALTLALAMTACGSSADDERVPGDTSVTPTSVRATTLTTSAPATTAGRTCAAILADGVKLANDYRNESRGIAGADEAKYRARAQALGNEARRLGCPVPAAVDDLLR